MMPIMNIVTEIRPRREAGERLPHSRGSSKGPNLSVAGRLGSSTILTNGSTSFQIRGTPSPLPRQREDL